MNISCTYQSKERHHQNTMQGNITVSCKLTTEGKTMNIYNADWPKTYANWCFLEVFLSGIF